MTICFVCGEYPPVPHGGIGTITRMLARGMVEAGHRVRVIGIVGRASTAPPFEMDGTVQVWRLKEPPIRGGWMVARARLYRAIARWSRSREIDLVEVPDWQGWAAGWPALDVPVVTRLHGSGTYFAAEMGARVRSTTRALERFSFRRSEFWCSTSRYTAQRTQSLFSLRNDPVAVLPNPVDVADEFTAVPRSRSDVVFSGTLTAKKGVVPLVDAWTIVHAQRPFARLHVFGADGRTADGASMQASLEERLAGPARGSVTFHGYSRRDTVLDALRRARVAVFPSFAEAFAMAPLEALACGCPTVSSTRGSGPEQFEHDRHGLMVDPSDVAAIAAAVIRVLDDDALAERLGAAGRALAQTRYSLATSIDANLAMYRSCVEQFAAARHDRAVCGAAAAIR